MAVRLFLIS